MIFFFSSKTETGKCCKISWVLIEWYLPFVIYGHFSPSYRSHLKKVNCINILGNNGSRKCLIFISTKTDVMVLGSLADVGEHSLCMCPGLSEWIGWKPTLWACYVLLKHKKRSRWHKSADCSVAASWGVRRTLGSVRIKILVINQVRKEEGRTALCHHLLASPWDINRLCFTSYVVYQLSCCPNREDSLWFCDNQGRFKQAHTGKITYF